MPIQEHGHSDQTAAELQKAKVQANVLRAERKKLRAEEGVEAMSDYLAELEHTRTVTAKLRAERLAREAALNAPITEAPVKTKAKRKPRKLSS